MNFFKLYIGDYQRDTAHLSLLEHGVYLLMLQHYYATEKPLPVGKALHRMLRATEKAEREAIDSVVEQFWVETDDGLVNERADVEIMKASTQADTNRRIAVEREEKRRAAREQHERSTNRVTNAQPSQTPDTRHQKNPEAAHFDVTIPGPEKPLRAAPPDPVPKPPESPTRRGAVAVLLRSLGVACTYADPTVVEWASTGVPDELLREAVSVARQRKPAPESIPVRYLVPIVSELVAKPVDAGGMRERDWSRIWPDEPAEVSP